MNNYKLTKSRIISGNQCEKKLWFDINDPEDKQKFEFERGYRFEDEVKKIYAKGRNAVDLSKDKKDRIIRTDQAINSKDINIIFEGAFVCLDTYVRTDILIRKNKEWELFEIKSSKEKKDVHILDLAIQSYILKKSGVSLTSFKLILINEDFILKKEGDYKDLPVEVDVTSEVVEKEEEISDLIKKLLPITKKSSCPKKDIGDHCKKPYSCDYMDRCKPKFNITPYTILPVIGSRSKKLKEHMQKEGTMDLQKVPTKFFPDKPYKNYAPNCHKIIQECHKKNKPWFSDNLKNIFEEFKFPFYFMDFETVMQGVPIIKGTQPNYPLPFQWSVHKWESVDKKIKKDESFLKFKDQDIERQFIEKLLKSVGEDGTIFAHNAEEVEIKILNKLKDKDNCKDLTDKINKLIDRVEDSLIIARKNFYSPPMNGSWTIKSIIKAIPDSGVSYDEEDNIAGGSDAQLAWFICTDPKTFNNDKEKQKRLLKDYCSKDTLAVYHLVKYLMEKVKDKKN